MRGWTLCLILAPAAAWSDIHYVLTPDPPARSVRIEVSLDSARPQETFRIPAWCPGYYNILEYQDKIFDVRAVAADGSTLTIERPDPRGWRVRNPSGGPVRFSYRVLGDEPGLGFFHVNVQPHTAFVNGPGAFVFLEGRLEERSILKLNLPKGWDVATAMDRLEGPDHRFASSGYDEFADHPIQVGIFERRPFEIDGVPYEAVYVSSDATYEPNLEALTERLRRVSRPAVKMFGGVPFPRYLYLVHLAVGGFMGGLEHRASNVIAMPNTRDLDIDSLAAHEFFHVWNVKHIRPRVLGPFDYTQPVRTANLWFSEGVTDYYANRHTYQSGLWSQPQLLRMFASEVATLQASQNRLRLTLEQTSWRAWENGGFGVGDLSYYNKGLLAGLLFDAAIRSETQGRRSLDDVLRILFERHRLPRPGFAEDGLLPVLDEVAGRDMRPLYDRIVRSNEELPYELLAGIGMRVLFPGSSAPTLDFSTRGDVVVEVGAGALLQGLEVGDRILQVNGRPMGPGAFAGVVGDYDMTVRRQGAEHALSMRVVQVGQRGFSLEQDPFATAEAIRRREEWLAVLDSDR
jgi:predicted metalloprotease with PDZ domain